MSLRVRSLWNGLIDSYSGWSDFFSEGFGSLFFKLLVNRRKGVVEREPGKLILYQSNLTLNLKLHLITKKTPVLYDYNNDSQVNQ